VCVCVCEYVFVFGAISTQGSQNQDQVPHLISIRAGCVFGVWNSYQLVDTCPRNKAWVRLYWPGLRFREVRQYFGPACLVLLACYLAYFCVGPPLYIVLHTMVLIAYIFTYLNK
jgi:hypothetical protein